MYQCTYFEKWMKISFLKKKSNIAVNLWFRKILNSSTYSKYYNNIVVPIFLKISIHPRARFFKILIV